MKGRGNAVAKLEIIRNIAPPAPPPPTRYAIELHSPVQHLLAGYVAANRATPGLTMVAPGIFAGAKAAVCGAGPSLNDARITGVSHIFACNSALQHLLRQGVAVTGAVGIDQSPGLLREWSDPPDVPYYVATSCDPALIAHLVAHGRRLLFFHNYVGFDGEIAYYNAHYPPGYVVGEGFTVVSRFIGICKWTGIERVDLYGADCAFGTGDAAHANGDTPQAAYGNPLIMQGEIDGRTWRTRPDMLREAVHLVRRVREMQGALRLMGDTLPVALLGKGDDYLTAVCRDVPAGELPPLPT